METFEIEISSEDAKGLEQEDLDMEILLQETFNLEEHRQLMKTAIERENSIHSGCPELECFTIDRIQVDYAALTGKFRVFYDINFTFGCEGKRIPKEDRTSEWTFAYDSKHHSILFKGSPYRDLRTTADEF